MNIDLNNERDRMIWKLAKKRVGFRRHLIAYLAVNSLLWILWLIGDKQEHTDMFPWPLWCTIGWGIGLIFSFLEAFVISNLDSVDEEFKKLKDRIQ